MYVLTGCVLGLVYVFTSFCMHLCWQQSDKHIWIFVTEAFTETEIWKIKLRNVEYKLN